MDPDQVSTISTGFSVVECITGHLNTTPNEYLRVLYFESKIPLKFCSQTFSTACFRIARILLFKGQKLTILIVADVLLPVKRNIKYTFDF